MAVQSEINPTLGFGVVGEIQDSTPNVVDTYIVSGTGAKVAYAFTSTVEGKAVVGGTGIFVGIACNPKAYANYNGDLSPNVDLKEGTIVELLTKGRILLNVGGAGAIGDGIYFVNATGAIGTGTATTGQTQIAGAEIVKYVAGSNGLALVQIW